jgi:hypothetical protein
MSKKPTAKGIIKSRYASKLEASYAERLDLLKHAGEILEWQYEPARFRLSDKPGPKRMTSFYTPDFGVLMPDGIYEMHEVKGFWRPAEWVRIRAAAMMYPLRFVGITREKGSFIREVVRREE